MTQRSRPHSWKALPPADQTLSSALLEWFEDHGRSFPWRRNRDPYRLLCTEIMLQRTRASQVASVYREKVADWTGPRDVVNLGQDSVRDLFDGLGLAWRARYFWELQEVLLAEHDRQVPRDYDVLVSLPGVGPYVATAVRVFAFGASETVVDSNVLRIFGRHYGIDFPDHARRSPRVLSWASDHSPCDENQCRVFNWGLIDLGATVCTPRDPVDDDCPLVSNCWRAKASSDRREQEPSGQEIPHDSSDLG